MVTSPGPPPPGYQPAVPSSSPSSLRAMRSKSSRCPDPSGLLGRGGGDRSALGSLLRRGPAGDKSPDYELRRMNPALTGPLQCRDRRAVPVMLLLLLDVGDMVGETLEIQGEGSILLLPEEGWPGGMGLVEQGRGGGLHLPHETGDRQLGWDGYHHMDVVLRSIEREDLCLELHRFTAEETMDGRFDLRRQRGLPSLRRPYEVKEELAVRHARFSP